MDIKVASGVIDRILREAGKAHPREACGILLGEGDRISDCVATRNVHPAPATHFEIDPQALIDAHRASRKGGPQVIGYYHSHPEGNPDLRYRRYGAAQKFLIGTGSPIRGRSPPRDQIGTGCM